MPPRKYARRSRRRPAKKTLISRRTLRHLKLGTYNFKKTIYQKDTYSVAANGTDMFSNYSITIQLLSDYASLKALFEMYRINRAVIEVIPKYSNVNDDATSGQIYPPVTIMTVIDPDDVDVSGYTVNDLTEYKTLKTTRSYQVHRRSFVPAMGISTESLGIGKIIKYKQWVDFASDQTEFFGYKIGFINVPTISSTTFKYDTKLTLYFTCKGSI